MNTLNTKSSHSIGIWLLICAALVLCMIVLGGVTRLTHSGLSIVEWQPISGIVPPLSESAWLDEFNKYKQFPEFQKVNHQMSLDEFKSIYWFEFAHRALGRIIGVVFILPLMYFFYRKRVSSTLSKQLMIILLLGFIQGYIGWFMVKSGLVDNPRVSQYRLVLHLGMATIIYGYLFYAALGEFSKEKFTAIASGGSLSKFCYGVTAIVFVMILSGGFVAGTRAGFLYPTFPLMNGQWMPPEVYAMEPAWLSIFEDMATIQWNHRVLALGVFLSCLILGFKLFMARLESSLTFAAHLMMALMLIQVTLGITTLLFHIPVPLAALHQGFAILLFTSLVYLSYQLKVRGH